MNVFGTERVNYTMNEEWLLDAGRPSLPQKGNFYKWSPWPLNFTGHEGVNSFSLFLSSKPI
jgi:hypothetical protein